MKRILLLLGLRVVVSFAVASTVLLFFVLYPHNRALDTVRRQVSGTRAMFGALQKGQKELKELAGPNTIKPRGNDAAKTYAQLVNRLLPTFNTEEVGKASVLTPQWRGLKITEYNNIVDDPQYAIAVSQASVALKNGKAFLDHHYAIMRAVANVLDYDPTKDTASGSGEEIYNRLVAAGGGLELALQRVKSAPKYKDSSMQDIADRIGQIEAARKLYENAVSADRSNGVERTAYIEAFSSAQSSIIGSRQSFWDVNYETLLKDITLAETALRDYASRLNNL